MDRNTLPDTADFEIKIVKAVKALEVDCYGVYNKSTDVLEHKDTSLTRCYKALLLMQKEYSNMLIEIKKEEKATKLRDSKIIKLT